MPLSLWRALFLWAVAGLLFGGLAFGQQAQPDPMLSTILFVCEHGAAKSVIAAAYFDKLAQARGLKYKAVFRGPNPDPALAPVLGRTVFAR